MTRPTEAEPVAGGGSEAMVAISDPGEVGRATQTRGDRLIVQLGNLLAWLFPLLMIVIVAQVALRNFGRVGVGPGNQAWMDDLQWWLYGAAVLVGVGYAVTTNSHVRVDIFYDGFRPAKKRRYDLFGLAWLFLPFVILCWDITLTYALQSIASREGSSSPNGLHNLWLLKSFVNVAFLLIAAATWFAYCRLLARLTWPHWWKRLLFALPSVWFAVQLAIWYAAAGATILLTEAETLRDATRTAFFDEVELLPGQDAKITVLVALAVTLALIGLAYALRDRSKDGVRGPDAEAA